MSSLCKRHVCMRVQVQVHRLLIVLVVYHCTIYLEISTSVLFLESENNMWKHWYKSDDGGFARADARQWCVTAHWATVNYLPCKMSEKLWKWRSQFLKAWGHIFKCLVWCHQQSSTTIYPNPHKGKSMFDNSALKKNNWNISNCNVMLINDLINWLIISAPLYNKAVFFVCM